MRHDEYGTEERTLWCGGLSDQVTDEVLYELFLQAGPLESVKRPRDPNGRPKFFAFIVYKHECSVPYAMELFQGEKLFNRPLNLRSSGTRLHHIPVLNTHITDFSERPEDYPRYDEGERSSRNDRRHSDHNHQHDEGERSHGKDRRRSDYNHEYDEGERTNRRDRKRSDHTQYDDDEGTSRNDRRHEKKRDNNEPSSWAELNALRGKGSLLNGHRRDDLQGTSRQSRDSGKHNGSQDAPESLADFKMLFQLGNQMLPGMASGMLPFGTPGPMGMLGPMNMMMGPMNMMGPMGPGLMMPGPMGVYPSMQGNMSGGRHSPPDKERNNYRDERRNRRGHPYHDQRQERQNDRRDNNYDHRRHDRGYSSSKSSHERERRDRRSR